MNTIDLTANDLNEALFATTGDAMLVETKEQAKYVKSFLVDKTISAILPGDRDFSYVCNRLDLSDVNHPRMVYKIIDSNGADAGYLALPEDWD